MKRIALQVALDWLFVVVFCLVVADDITRLVEQGWSTYRGFWLLIGTVLLIASVRDVLKDPR